MHRLLKTLEKLNLVTQDPTNKAYYIGYLVNQIAAEPQNSNRCLISCAIGVMEHLFETSEDTVILHIMMGIRGVSLHTIVSAHDLRVIAQETHNKIQYSGATYKVLLSQLEDKEIELIIRNITIKPATKLTITDKNEFIKQVKQAREQGYAVSIGERLIGGLSLSAPIKNYAYPTALTILGPENRIKPKINYLLEELKASTNRISKKIL